MLRRRWTFAASGMDEPCPEFDGWSGVFRVGLLVEVRSWTDVFTLPGLCGDAVFEAHPSWREGRGWAGFDAVASAVHEWLTGLLFGIPLPDGAYCLPFEWASDVCRIAGEMLDAVRSDPDLKERAAASGGWAAFALETAGVFMTAPVPCGPVEEPDMFPEPFVPQPPHGFGLYAEMEEGHGRRS